jgi:SNF2 family DNA or RNA helicase
VRKQVWNIIWGAPQLPGGERIAEATSAVVPWPHQVRAFERMVGPWSRGDQPPRLLIADEVGLGKTVEAGLLLRHAWLSGRSRRILVLAPKAVMTQWQIELREKFNLNCPLYDGKALKW